MEQIVQAPVSIVLPNFQDAWQMVLGQLRAEMSRAQFETWVEPLKALGYHEGVFTIGAYNPYSQKWAEARLKARISALLSGLYQRTVTLRVVVSNTYAPDNSLTTVSVPGENIQKAEKNAPEREPSPAPGEPSKRKVMLQRAYGSERAGIIQPERGMFLTSYCFTHWLPILGHSAFTVILAARSMCYWNPLTGELRNVVETEMGDLAKRASVSVRTVKDVLASDLVKRYFLRYKVRRMMTPNGVRTAGIFLQVRMDDPLTPEDQERTGLLEEEKWYLPDFEDDWD